MKIKLDTVESIEDQRGLSDLIVVYKMDTFMSVKGYLQKLIDLCHEWGYYKDNESIFVKTNQSKETI